MTGPLEPDGPSGDRHAGDPGRSKVGPGVGVVPDDQIQEDVWRLQELARSHGLRFWDVEFEVVTRQKMVELGTYVLPYRFAHWTFGREYARMQKFHDLGLVEILETVINSRPAHAYLLDANSRDDDRMVIAHVLAHVDFFANNMWFERTPRNILAEARQHEHRIRRLREEFGPGHVERILDRAMSIQWHVDFWRHFRTSQRQGDDPSAPTGDEQQAPPPGMTPSDLSLGGRQGPTPPPLPPLVPGPGGHRDVLEFLVAHGPLDEVEHAVLEMVRQETLYFYPNAITKIMNEGWATYWHMELLREFLSFEAFDRFAVKHSHLMAAEGLNPYKLGALIFEDIRARGDADFGPGQGIKQMFEARRYHDDVSFIREHLTPDVVAKAGLFLYEQDAETGEQKVTSTSTAEIKDAVIKDLENLGKPNIVVASGDHEARGELLLAHKHDGRDLDIDFASDVLKQVHGFWKRPVHIETLFEGQPLVVSFDGNDVTRTRPEEPPVAPEHLRIDPGAGGSARALAKLDDNDDPAGSTGDDVPAADTERDEAPDGV